MKLPKMSAGIERFGVSRAAEDKSGVLPSWPPKIKWPPKANWCKIRCASKAAAMVAACDAASSGAAAVCHAAAAVWENNCKNDC